MHGAPAHREGVDHDPEFKGTSSDHPREVISRDTRRAGDTERDELGAPGLDPDSLAPVALIDWDLGTRGDPLWDLAVLLSYWAEPGDPPAMLALGQMPTHGHGFPGRDAVMRRYAETTGRDLSRFRAHRAIASFRLAVVFRQIFRRWRDTGVGDERCAGFDDLSLGLLEFAGAVAQGRFV